MPKFIIEQYELHTSKYEIDAPTRADAVVGVLNSRGTRVDDSGEFIHMDYEHGMPLEELTEEEVEYIQKEGNWKFDYDHVETIRSIEEVKEDTE
jgi:hypothetical protein